MIAGEAAAVMAAMLVAPYLCAALLPLLRKWPNLRETVTLSTAALASIAALLLVGPILSGQRPELELASIAPGLSLAFALEPLGVLFAAVASVLWLANSLYSIGYMRAHDEPRQTTFYVCFAIAFGCTIGIAFAANLFTLFLFYEGLTLSTYPLVTHNRTPEAVRGGRTYLLLLLGTSLLLFLPAIVVTWFTAGTLAFTPEGILAGKAEPLLMAVLLAMYVFGIGKAAIMPVHFWLPAAMVAPTPVSAFLHAVAVVKAGVFAILKVVIYIFGVPVLAELGQSGWFTAASGLTVLLASVVALRQDNLKRRLAYSTVSQLSYVLLGAAILTPISILGAALHIAAHALGKITLFFAAGSIATAAHLTQVSQLNGIGRRMPWTMGAFAIGTLSMIGLPPTGGFIGKWFMLTGAMQTSNWFAVAVLVLGTVLSAGYLLPVVYRAFFLAAPESREGTSSGEAPWPIVLALSLTAAGSLLLFFLHATPLALASALIEPFR